MSEGDIDNWHKTNCRVIESEVHIAWTYSSHIILHRSSSRTPTNSEDMITNTQVIYSNRSTFITAEQTRCLCGKLGNAQYPSFDVLSYHLRMQLERLLARHTHMHIYRETTCRTIMEYKHQRHNFISIHFKE